MWYVAVVVVACEMGGGAVLGGEESTEGGEREGEGGVMPGSRAIVDMMIPREGNQTLRTSRRKGGMHAGMQHAGEGYGSWPTSYCVPFHLLLFLILKGYPVTMSPNNTIRSMIIMKVQCDLGNTFEMYVIGEGERRWQCLRTQRRSDAATQ